MRLRCGEQAFDVQASEANGAWVGRVDGREVRFTLEPAGPGVFVVRSGDRVATLHLARDGATVHLSWEGVAHALVEDGQGLLAAHRGVGAGAVLRNGVGHAPTVGRNDHHRQGPSGS
jgi:hypothetical protein